MIGPILAVTLPGFVLGALLMALGSTRVPADVARARWLKLAVYFLIVHGVLGAAAAGTLWFTALMVVIVAGGTRELAGAWRRMAPPRPAVVWPFYAGVSMLAVVNVVLLRPPALAFLFVVAASFDGFSQVVGQWLGRSPLAPRISPAKTVEGLLGGLLGAAAFAIAMRSVLGVPAWQAGAWGVATGAAALVGDLSTSWIKRRAGIKDFADTLPGHGGVLDRFDSFLAAAALVGLAWWLAGTGSP